MELHFSTPNLGNLFLDAYKAYFYTLDETGKYPLFGTEKDKRVDSLIMPSFWLRPAWLWKSNVLDPFHCFVEMMGGREAAIRALFDDKST